MTCPTPAARPDSSEVTITPRPTTMIMVMARSMLHGKPGRRE
jgi:hypothetical protein